MHAPVGYATHYHANYVSPYWAPKLTKISQLGAHIFYRWPGKWGMPGAFTDSYSGVEGIPALTNLAALGEEGLITEQLKRLEGEGSVVLRYARNPNGSVGDVAGLCNRGGNVLGLMPHPERACDPCTGGVDGRRLLAALLG